jgi:hypothetical protein
MGGPSTNTVGNVSLVMVLNLTLSPASVAPNTSVEQTFSVPGLHLGDFVDTNSTGANQPGLSISNNRVTANGTLGLTFENGTAATITPTAATVYSVFVARCENYPDGGAPSAISA